MEKVFEFFDAFFIVLDKFTDIVFFITVIGAALVLVATIMAAFLGWPAGIATAVGIGLAFLWPILFP